MTAVSVEEQDPQQVHPSIVRHTFVEEIKARGPASSGDEPNMVDESELFKVFDQSGLANTKDIKKTAEFRSRSNGRYVYLNKTLFLDNRIFVYIEDTLPESRIHGIRELGVRFSSNLTEFPSRMHTGKTQCHYGRAVEADNYAALSDFLRWFNSLS